MQKKKRIVNEKLLESVREKPCCICGKPPRSEASHIKSIGAGGDDIEWNVLPKCRVHHHEWHQMGVLSFCRKHSLFTILLISLGWEITTEGIWHE
jgi:hypothetical protein